MQEDHTALMGLAAGLATAVGSDAASDSLSAVILSNHQSATEPSTCQSDG